MRVYKFGGASIADAQRMAALLPIIKEQKESLVIVISAIGKTTNALECIVSYACAGELDTALQLSEELYRAHLAFVDILLQDCDNAEARRVLKNQFHELDIAIRKADESRYDYSYDQVVSMGELFSSGLLYALLDQSGMLCEWIDIRKIVRTDDTYRDAVVDWETTKQNAEQQIGRELAKGRVVVTQGFIGSAPGNESVTLGREGSDYTAAMLAAMLHAGSVTIWKDVEGLQNADPKQFPGTVKIDAISYNEVIEMAFYGAQIIHPKTIKPLQNNNIPLYVRCFLDRGLPGTIVQAEVEASYPPLIVLKEDQLLLQVTTRDFSFITEDNLSRLYSVFHSLKIKVNLIQNAAISFVACIDNREDKVRELLDALVTDYKVTLNEQVSLLTVRHYAPGTIMELTDGRQILLKQETRKTVQVVMK